MDNACRRVENDAVAVRLKVESRRTTGIYLLIADRMQSKYSTAILRSSVGTCAFWDGQSCRSACACACLDGQCVPVGVFRLSCGC